MKKKAIPKELRSFTEFIKLDIIELGRAKAAKKTSIYYNKSMRDALNIVQEVCKIYNLDYKP